MIKQENPEEKKIKGIEASFIESLPSERKNDYIWKLFYKYKDEQFKKIFRGIRNNTINNEKKYIFVKQLFIDFNESKQEKLKKILKEIYFLYLLKNTIYFVQISDYFYSDNKKFINLFFESDSLSLDYLISSKVYKYDNKLIKWIIYQITYGLYILHENGIIHHNIKSSKILIDSKGGISICHFGSAFFKKNEHPAFYTLCYASPEYLNDTSNSDEKYDIWGLGVIMLELYLKILNIFKKDGIDNRIDQLKYLQTFFEETENDNLNNPKYQNKNFKNFKNLLEQINDTDAKDFLKNILVFDPKKRYSAKRALESKYLEEFYGIDPLDALKIPSNFDYNKIAQNEINHDKFIEMVEEIKK